MLRLPLAVRVLVLSCNACRPGEVVCAAVLLTLSGFWDRVSGKCGEGVILWSHPPVKPHLGTLCVSKQQKRDHIQ